MTGGTFSTVENNGVRSLGDTPLNKSMLELVHPASSYDILQPLNVLSENITTKDWQILLDTFKAVDFAN